MSLQYYRFFPGDYARDTRHLSMMQQGAYRQLIDEYMAHGPLPNDLQRLYRICSAFSAEERAAVEYVIGEFFRLDGPTWRHKRCDQEREWQEKKSNSAKEAVSKRWLYGRNTDVLRTKYERNTNQNKEGSSTTRGGSSKVSKSFTDLLSSSDASAAEAAPAPAPPAVISIPLNDKTDYPVTQPMIDEWVALYPDCDVLQTLREIRGWNLANPRKRKTRSGILNHINRWLAMEHDRG